MSAPTLRAAVEGALDAAEAFWAPFVERAVEPGAAFQDDAADAATDATLAAYNILHEGGLDEDVALLLARALAPYGLRRAAAVAEVPLVFEPGGSFNVGEGGGA